MTKQHILEALQAELGSNLIQGLELTVKAGLPSTSSSSTTNKRSLELPLTLSGQVVFGRSEEVIGEESLSRIMTQTFKEENAKALYLFRLSIAQDPTLKQVSDIKIETKEDQQPQRDDTPTPEVQQSSDDQFLSTLLIAIIASVGAAIVAVVCFVYC